MDAVINGKLKEIEEQRGVRVLFACETGSRAWGFPSPDSDYDVRMIYKHDLDWYLSLSEQKNTIEFMSADGELDVTGWDIKKCLQLMWRSNGALLERVQSPIVYRNEWNAGALLKAYAELCYSPIATMHHYLGMAKKSFAAIEGEKEIKLKSLFYALRASLACKWILNRDLPPPIVFTEMVDELVVSNDFKRHIYSLIALKSEKPESYIHPAEIELNKFIAEELLNADRAAASLPGRKQKNVPLDELFKEFVKK